MLPSRIFFDNFLDDFEPKKINNFMKCDIYEENDNYVIEIDAPGMKKENINIEFEDGNLIITAEKEEEEKENKKYLHRERHMTTRSSRSFYLGDIDENAIKAEFNNGILKISVPKNNKEKNTKKIISID